MLPPTALALLVLAAAEPRLAVDLRLQTPFRAALGRELLAVDPGALAAPAEPSRGVRAGAVVGASAGIALADAGSLALMLGAFASSCFLESCPAPAWVGPALIAGLVSYVFLPPAMGVWFARSASGGDHATAAYWYAFLVRLGAMAALGAGPIGPLAYLVAELVVAPYVIASVLATPPAGPATAPIPVAPERDPALAWRSR